MSLDGRPCLSLTTGASTTLTSGGSTEMMSSSSKWTLACSQNRHMVAAENHRGGQGVAGRQSSCEKRTWQKLVYEAENWSTLKTKNGGMTRRCRKEMQLRAN
ncbi:hypothetical protein BASA60_008001 [Batrachochytrium salamandrivorans]|nr:hypothetical protein BASA60_008001 [Batrachochytrium salamandrivorans]